MTSYLALLVSEPVSLPSFSLSSIFARVNQQQASFINFHCPSNQQYFTE